MFRDDHEISRLFLRISIALRPSPPGFGVIRTSDAGRLVDFPDELDLDPFIQISRVAPFGSGGTREAERHFMLADYSWAGKIQAEIPPVFLNRNSPFPTRKKRLELRLFCVTVRTAVRTGSLGLMVWCVSA
jgi:hypothetical protein